MMKPGKLQLLGIATAAILLLSALTAAEASALETVFLVDGVRPTEPVATSTEGLFFIEVQTSTKEFVILIDCSGLFNGTVATGGNAKLDEITKIFNLAGEEIGELGGRSLDCEIVNTSSLSCTNSNKLAEFWPDNLPWPSSLVLLEGGFDDRDEGGKIPGFDLACLDAFNLQHETLCEGPLFALLENTVENDIFAKFPVQEFGKPCSFSGELGFVEGSWLMTVPGKTLSVGEG